MKQVLTHLFTKLGWTRFSNPGAMPCHLIGAVSSALLIAAIAWTGSRNGDGPVFYQHGEILVDLSDANALMENADEWRKLYTINYRRSETVTQRVAAIRNWLPTTVDWNATQQDLRRVGEASDLKILQLTRAKRHVGARVGVVTASCVAQGSFESLCRFLQHLSDRSQPIACSGVELHRLEENRSIQPESDAPPCRATLTLRIPFAAPGTASGQLVSPEVRDAI